MSDLPFEDLLHAARNYRARTGHCWVTLSYAQSLDGSLAGPQGQPLRLSGEAAMKMTHELRAAHAAILVGIGTVLADNPRLTVRLVTGPQPQPVVLDSRLRMPLEGLLWEHPKPVWVATGPSADSRQVEKLRAAGAQVLTLPLDDAGKIPLASLLGELSARGIDSLMVEGGASVLTSFLRSGLANAVVITLAPVFAGGLRAVNQPLDLEEKGVFPHLDDLHSARFGADLVVWGRLA